MHLLEPVADELERLAEAGLERALQLLLDRGPHLVELGLVALLQGAQLALQRGAHLAQVQLDRTRQVGELLLHARGEVLQLLRAFLAIEASGRLRQLGQARDLLAEARQLLGLQSTQSRHLLHQSGLQLAQARPGLHAQAGSGGLDGSAQLAFEPFAARPSSSRRSFSSLPPRRGRRAMTTARISTAAAMTSAASSVSFMSR